MISDLGLLLLTGALASALVVLYWHRQVALLRISTYITAGSVGIAFLLLLVAFVRSDASVLLVVRHSHPGMSTWYKALAVWGNHEGSMLLWVWLFSLYTAFFAYKTRTDSSALIRYTLLIQQGMMVGWLVFLCAVANPFWDNAMHIPFMGLNPLLQDVALAIHPPLLYAGFVGYGLGSAISIAALITRTPKWISVVYPWALLSWCFLTAGIAMGSWWAYRELGWGGFWFWDPVENVSLMPWLLGTAWIHALQVAQKRQLLTQWSLILGWLTFSLCVLGTFLVRSGVLLSVHNFAYDPARGLYLMAGVALLWIVGTILSFRAPQVSAAVSFHWRSREMGILIQHVLLLTACFTIVLATFYPMFMEWTTGDRATVGGYYYQHVATPLAWAIGMTMVITPALSWRQGRWRSLLLPFAIGVLLAIGGMWYHRFTYGWGLCVLGIWIVSATVLRAAQRWFRVTRPHWISELGLCFAHMGWGLLCIGVGVYIHGAYEVDRLLASHEEMRVGEYRISLEGATYHKEPGYYAQRASIHVFREADEVAVLFPEMRLFPVEDMKTTEAALYTTWLHDVYVITGAVDASDRLPVRVYYNPGIRWIWMAAVCMVMGGAVVLIRYIP